MVPKNIKLKKGGRSLEQVVKKDRWAIVTAKENGKKTPGVCSKLEGWRFVPRKVRKDPLAVSYKRCAGKQFVNESTRLKKWGPNWHGGRKGNET